MSSFGRWSLLGAWMVLAGHSNGQQHRSWRQYGGSADQSKYVEFAQITRDNVAKLELAWIYPTSNGSSSMFNPIVVDNVMYLLAKNNSLVALDAVTGREIWIHTNLTGIIKRGINYWESSDRKDRRLLFCMRDTLQAIDATTGKSIMSFGTDGTVSLKEGLERDPATIRRVQSTTPGAIFDNLIMLGSSPGENFLSAPGHLRAYDVVTGKLVWTFHTIPLPGEFGYDTWPKEAYKYVGGVNTWGEITVDEKRGIAYFPLGSPTYDYYGADRLGANLFGNCLLALDARTGKRLWHFQAVHHDLWDYDLCAAPQLITIQHNGRAIDAVAVATKQGFLFVFDRVTGEPLWPIEERKVTRSETPGEESWPTQPFPTVVPPFNRQAVTVADLNSNFTDAQREMWTKRLNAAKHGLFEPLSVNQETAAMPGATGGANFGNTAANPKKGLVYVAAQEFPSMYRLKKEPALGSAPAAQVPTADQITRGKTAYTQSCQVCHGEKLTGVGPVPPLTNFQDRLNLDGFKTLVGVGRGMMPGFPHIDEATLNDLFAFLRNATRGGDRGRGGSVQTKEEIEPFKGPIVGSGGAFGDAPAQAPQRPQDRAGARNYPDGVTAPANHYTTGYGLEYPNLLRPPWSIIVAYDLNKGTIQWRRPLGHDRTFALEGDGTGVPNGSQRKGMVVTSTGLIFATCKDGKIYAYDADDGRMLWNTQLPRNPEGLMTMYEANGRQYLVVCSMDFLIDKTKEPTKPPGYYVFSLPVTQ